MNEIELSNRCRSSTLKGSRRRGDGASLDGHYL